MKPRRILSAVVACSLLGACGIEPTNPWDPETPVAEQERSRVLGRVVLPTRDLEEKPLELIVLEGDGRVLEEGGTARVFRTRTSVEGLPAGWRDDGNKDAAGTFEITLPPGTWSVVFSAERNGELLYDDAATPNVTLRAGETAFQSLRPRPIPSDRFHGVVKGSVEGLSPGLSYVARLVSVTGEVEERTLVKSGDASFTFHGVVPGTEYRVRVEGDGYAPAVSPPFSVEAQHSAENPVVVPPLRLVSIGELFEVAFDEAGSEAPYVASAEVPVRLSAAHIFLSSSEEQGLHHVEVRALPAPVFDAVLADEAAGVEGDRRWRELPQGPFVVTLDEGLEGGAGDGEHTVLAQLRLCMQEPCDCPSDAPLSECMPPLASGIASLSLILDTEPPALVEVAVAGVNARPSTPAPPLTVSCARFGSLCPVANDADPYAPLVELTLNDHSGRVAGIALTLDAEEAPTTFSPLTSARGLATWGGLAPGIEPQDGEHVLRVWARDAAGNVGLVHERAIVVDVTPIALAAPALVLSGSQLYEVEGQPIEILPGDLLGVDVQTVDETPARWRVRRTDGPLLSGLPSTGFAPYEGPTTAFLSGLHGDTVTLEVSVEDAVGNVSTAPLHALRLWRTGRVLGSVSLEGGGDLSLLEPVLINADGERLLGDAFGDGTFSFDEAMRGVYTLELSVPGFSPYQRTGVVVEAARDTSLGVIPLARPRGHLVGRFVLEGREGATTNTGIQVSLLDEGGGAIAGTTTLADGTYRFRDVPVGTGYSVVAAFEGYASASHSGVEVAPEVESAVHPDDDGEPTPVVLRELVGDFRLCAATGVLADNCEPLLWTRHAEVDVGGVDLTGIGEYRVSTSPFPNDTAGWLPIAQNGDGTFIPPRVTLGDTGDGRYTVYLQLRVDEDNVGDVLTAEIVYDTTPPADVTLVLRRGTSALRDGFTNQATVSAVVSASAGSGDVAPLGSAFVRFADSAPTSPPATTRCAHGASCSVPLDDLEERVHRAWAFSCDAAGNCNETPVEARIVYDVTPPRTLHGVTLQPISSAIRTSGGVTYTRSTQYDIEVNVGAAETSAGTAVLDGAGAAVPDVVGYRFGVASVPPSGNGSFGFDGIELSQFTSLLAPNALLTAPGPALPAIEGAYRVYAQLVDAAGNATALEDNPYHFDLVLDETPPGVTFVLNGDDDFTNDPVVRLDTTASTIDPPVLAQIATDGGLFDTFEGRAYPFEPGLDTWDLGAAAPDGQKTVYVRFLDAAGNAIERSDSIFLDRTPPQALLVSCSTCSFHDGLAYTNDAARQVVLDLLATDNSGWVDLVDVTGLGAPAAYAPVLAVTLPDATDGTQALEVRFVDPAGNESTTTTLPVVLDRGAPVPSLSINGGANATNRATVQLTLSATDSTSPIVGMRLSNTAAFSGQVQTLSPELVWTLPFPDNDGPKTVYLEVYDAAGNRAETAASILLDTTPPSGSVILAGGAARTNQLTVDVALAYDADAVTHVLSTSPLDANCANAAFPAVDTPPPATTQVTFAPSESGEPEVRSLYVCTRDRAGNVAMAMDSIVLDQQGPTGTLVINGGATYTLDGTVSVALSAPGDTTLMKTAVNTPPDCSAANGYVAYASSFNATLANTSGTQTIYACLKDSSGNYTESPLFDRIIRDRQAPVVSLSIDGGAAYATRPVVTLQVSASDDLTEPEGGITGMRVSNNAAPTSGAYESFSGARTWTLDAPGLGGNKTVCVEVRDAAGRTGSACDSIILDLENPLGTVTLAGGASHSTSATVSAHFVGDGGPGYSLLYGEGALDCDATAGWVPFDGDETVQVTLGGEGYRELYACFREPSGRTTLASDGIIVDTEAPTAPKPAAPEAGAWVASARPTLRWSAASGADLYRLTVRNSANNVVLGPVDVFTTEHTPVSDLPEGALTWSVLARDAAGNESGLDAAFPRPLHIDTGAPTGLADLAVTSGVTTNNPTPTLSWRAANDTFTAANALAYTLEIADGTSFSALVLSAALENTAGAATMSYTLESPLGEGSYAWRVRVRDRAGNESVVDGPTFTIDLTPPASPAFEAVASPTRSPVELRWTAVAGAASYRVQVTQNAGQSGCGTFPPVSTLVTTTSYTLTTPNTSGCHYTARVSSLDALGNESAPSVVGFYVDTQAPTLGAPAIVINGGAAATASEVVTLSLNASGATQVRVHALETNNCSTPPSPPSAAVMAGLPAQPYSPVLTYVLPPNNPATNSGPRPSDECKWITVSFGDEAGNFTAPSTAAMDGILLDTLPPDAPQIATESSIVDAPSILLELGQDAVDHHFATYQIRNSARQSAWQNVTPNNPSCLTGPALCQFTVELRENSENRISVRALDTAGSPSAEDFIVITEDSQKPDRPASITLVPSNQRVDVSWPESSASDVAGYRLYYTLSEGDCASAEYEGAFAEQGPSPIDVGRNTSFTLTGMPNGIRLCVAVRAYDKTVSPGPHLSEPISDGTTPYPVSPVRLARLSGAQLGIGSSVVGGVAYEHGLLYLSAAGHGLIELDVTNEDCFALTDPNDFASCTGRLESAQGSITYPGAVLLHGGLAFVIDRSAGVGVHIYRTAHAQAPVYHGTVPAQTPTAMAASGTHFAIVDNNVVRLYDLRPIFQTGTPQLPTQRSTFTPGGNLYDVSIQGDLLAVSSNVQEQGLYDISNPSAPSAYPVQCATAGNRRAVLLTGGVLYSTHVNGDLQVCDLTTTDDNTFPAIGGATTSHIWRIRAAGPYLYVNGGDGFTVLDVSDRTNPTLVGQVGGSASQGQIAVHGHNLYLAHGGGSFLDVYELKRPNAFELVRMASVVDGATDGAMVGDVLVNGTFPPQVLHYGIDDMTLEDDTFGHLSSIVDARDGHIVSFRGHSFTLSRLSAAGGLELVQSHFFTSDPDYNASTKNLRANTGLLMWPWVIALASHDKGPSQRLFVRVYRVDNPGPTFPMVSERVVVDDLDENVAATTLPASIARYKNHLFVSTYTSSATDEDEGLYRLTVAPRTGLLAGPVKVDDEETSSLLVHGRRLYMFSSASSIRVQDLRAPGQWNNATIATVALSGRSPGSARTAPAGPYLFVPGTRQPGESSGRGTYLYELRFEDTAPWMPYATTTRAVFPSVSPMYITLAGDRVYVSNGSNNGMDILRLR